MNSLRNNHPVIILVPGHYMALSISNNGNVVLMDPYTKWSNKSKKSGEYKSISEIEHIYGSVTWAAAYSKI